MTNLMRMKMSGIISDIDIKDSKKSVTLAAIGYTISTVIYGVCLQELHTHSMELKPLHRGFEVPILITAAEFVSLILIVKLESLKGLIHHAEGLIVTLICHVAMEYLFNYWYIYSRQDSFAMGYFEPLVLVALLKLCTNYEVNLKIIFSLLTMSILAGFTSGDLWILTNANRSGIIIFLVIYFLSLQNLGINLLQEESVTFSFRKKISIIYSTTVLSLGAFMSTFHLTYWALPLMFAILAMFASVAMFFLTSILLQTSHLISVSVFGVLAQICVNLACVPGEHTHNILISIIAMLILVVIVWFYFNYVSNLESTSKPLVSVPHHEVYTRIEFIMFVGFFCGLLFYVFKPKFSKRDLNNLHYVGLDSIVKRLLNLQ